MGRKAIESVNTNEQKNAAKGKQEIKSLPAVFANEEEFRAYIALATLLNSEEKCNEYNNTLKANKLLTLNQSIANYKANGIELEKEFYPVSVNIGGVFCGINRRQRVIFAVGFIGEHKLAITVSTRATKELPELAKNEKVAEKYGYASKYLTRLDANNATLLPSSIDYNHFVDNNFGLPFCYSTSKADLLDYAQWLNNKNAFEEYKAAAAEFENVNYYDENCIAEFCAVAKTVLGRCGKVPGVLAVFVSGQGLYRLKVGLRIVVAGDVPANEIPEIADEILTAERLFQVAGDIGHAAYVGLDGLVGIFDAAVFEGSGEISHIGGEQQGAVLQHAALLYAEGIAGKLAPVYAKVVAAFQAGIDAQVLQGCQDGGGETAEHFCGVLVFQAGVDESEIHVAKVVEHGPAAGQPPHHGYVVFLDIVYVYLLEGILVLAYDDAGRISPQPEHRLGEAVQQIFLCREVAVGVRLAVNYKNHYPYY